MALQRRVAAGAVLVGAVLLAGGSLAGGAGGGQGSPVGPDLLMLGKRPPSPVVPQPGSPQQPSVQPPAVPPALATPPKATAGPAPVPAAAPEVRSSVETLPDATPSQERPIVVAGKPGGAGQVRSAPARQLPRTGAGASDLVALSGAALVLGGVSLFVAARGSARRATSPG